MGGTSTPLKTVDAGPDLSESALLTRRLVDIVWSEGAAKVGSEKSESNDHVKKEERILAMVKAQGLSFVEREFEKSPVRIDQRWHIGGQVSGGEYNYTRAAAEGYDNGFRKSRMSRNMRSHPHALRR